MDYYLSTALSSTVLLAATIGWIRFRKTGPAFLPFLLLLTLGALHEGVSFALNHLKLSNAVVYNVYSLLESGLIVVQVYRWKLFKISATALVLLLFVLTCAWTAETAVLFTPTTFCSYFTIVYSFLAVLLSIHTVNVLVNNEPQALVKHPVFLICLGFIVYFTYSIIVEVFWIYGLNHSLVFQVKINDILVVINAIVNLVYALAVLWIPNKQNFTLPSLSPAS